MRDENWEWDDKKALSNIREHDVSFEQAKAVFDDTWNIEIIDDREDYVDLNGDPEERINIIGLDAAGILLVVTYTMRGLRHRLISARKVENDGDEAREYYESRQQF